MLFIHQKLSLVMQGYMEQSQRRAKELSIAFDILIPRSGSSFTQYLTLCSEQSTTNPLSFPDRERHRLHAMIMFNMRNRSINIDQLSAKIKIVATFSKYLLMHRN